MAYSHVAHDCRVGSGCVIANSGTLAGHVTIEDKAVVGGYPPVCPGRSTLDYRRMF
jgi:UDP-N-acetylglucosamine acyltransferase